MKQRQWVVLLLLAGCGGGEPGPPARYAPEQPRPAPLPTLQAKVYDETVTGRFVSLVDFEDVIGQEMPAERIARHGYEQLRHFAVTPPDGARVRHVVNITRTGAGAMEVRLPAGASLVFRSPYIHDFSPYTLLSLAVYCPAVRDDLVVTLRGSGRAWRSMRRLTAAGWNTVLVDLARLTRAGKFDLRNVETIELVFANAAEPVQFNLDDIMLVDNRRQIPNTPTGVKLIKTGLDYTLTLPGWSAPLSLARSDDGLWRLGNHQVRLRIAERGQDLAAADVGLNALGRRRIGTVELLEVNPVRVRIANTWYFPPQAGEWIDLDVQRIRWEYTFYSDGRWVTAVTLNNAGGAELGGVRLQAPYTVAWSDGTIAAERAEPDFTGPVGQWAWLAAPPGPEATTLRANYARPAAMAIRLGRPAGADNLLATDGFDRTEGCYAARALGGNCRLTLRPRAQPLVRPAIRVTSPWKGPVTTNCDALPLPAVAPIAGGAVAVVPRVLKAPALVEFAGPIDRLEE